MERHYARYYKCALQVNPYSYSKFRGKAITDEKEYNEQILKECLKNEIKVVGLADHGSIDSSTSLRTYLSENDILTLPGFEISSAEKIHMVCLFSPEFDNSRLNRILGQLGLPTDIKNGTEASSLSCLEIAKKVQDNDGFWYAAHITGDNGILKIGKMNHIWKNELLSVAQIPNSVENIDPNYRNIIQNTDTNYKRNKPIAYINSSDIESPEDLSKPVASVLVKMSELSFQAFKMAFKDSESRIKLNSTEKKCYKSTIDEISISGGYLDGLAVAFSDEVSTIIGGRGTGKSTLINLIIYCLDKYHYTKEFEKYIDSFAESNLGTGGEVKLTITSYSQNGQQFNISRRYKQNITIRNGNGEISDLSIDEILPNLEIYAQNELIEVIKSKKRITESVKRLICIDSKILNKRKKAYESLNENTRELLRVSNNLEKLEKNTSDLPAKQSQLKHYNSIAGLEEKIAPITKITAIDSKISILSDAICNHIITDNKLVIESIIDEEDRKENNDLINLINSIEEYNRESQIIFKQQENIFSSLKEKVSETKESWEKYKQNEEIKFKEIFKDIPEVQDKNSKEVLEEYRSLLKEINDSKPTLLKIETTKEELEELKKVRKELLENCKETNTEYINAVSKRIKKLNKSNLGKLVKIDIDCLQNKESLLEKLKKLDGIGDKSIQSISDYKNFDMITFIENIRKGPVELAKEYNLTSSTSQKICGLTNEQCWKLEELVLGDITNISLKVGDQFKSMDNLSKGQQCTALLNILLVENRDPLIIDQPEDNLDNAYIADSLVASIRNNKINRQYIFATHNANIPVFGDAELIIGLVEEDGQGKINGDAIGSIDNKQVMNQVVNILEGGETAFKIRKEKYQF